MYISNCQEGLGNGLILGFVYSSQKVLVGPWCVHAYQMMIHKV